MNNTFSSEWSVGASLRQSRSGVQTFNACYARVTPVVTLLVQSCSATKKSVDGPVPARDLYDGYFHRIIAKARREGQLTADLSVAILSAEHGLIAETEEIETYDRKMDRSRAEQLAPTVTDALVEAVEEGGHEQVVANAGREYARALTPGFARVDADTYRIDGSGIGEKGSKLKQFLRGDESVLSAWDPTHRGDN